MINPNDYMTISTLIEAGMQDSYAQAAGGFVIVRFSDGTYNWFPIGAIPQRADGTIERYAPIVMRFRYDDPIWRSDSVDDVR